MDLLASLNVEDLPEQQTRLLHLINNSDQQLDSFIHLGHDACCTCGTSLQHAVIVPCRACQRVRYCSEACREQDSNPPPHGEEMAAGHSALVCSLLSLCNDDDQVVEEDGGLADPVRVEAARDRIRSEYESYPATLANVLSEGPCYQPVFKKCASSSGTLVIHVIGASEDAELSQGPTVLRNSCGDDGDDEHAVVRDYAEALAELAETNGLARIELLFVGPQCPASPWQESAPMKVLEKHVGVLAVRTIKSLYNQRELFGDSDIGTVAKPDIVVFFNPGFTVPDYQQDWNQTLRSIPANTPFLSTTNTEMEGIADAQYLLDQDKIRSLPVGLADIFGVYSGDGAAEEASLIGSGGGSFFAANPFAGNRVRQNSSMANDLFVKNRWMLGGIIGSFDPSSASSRGNGPAKKAKTVGEGLSNNNNKAGNPALI